MNHGREPRGQPKAKRVHGPSFHGPGGLRRRCPSCGCRRRFREPPGDQGGSGRRFAWVKVDGMLVCKMCAPPK